MLYPYLFTNFRFGQYWPRGGVTALGLQWDIVVCTDQGLLGDVTALSLLRVGHSGLY